jgi:hypothetical protein
LKIHIITSCAGEKLHSPENQLTQQNYGKLHDSEQFGALEEEIAPYCTPAKQLDTCQQHARGSFVNNFDFYDREQ